MILIKILFFCNLVFAKAQSRGTEIPIYFSEYGITISSISQLGDTLNYNKSSKEDFKLVFYDIKGKCYLERYVNGKICEKGYFENSLDTLKKYVTGRDQDGNFSPIRIYQYFEPLKDGEWIIYKKNKVLKESYSMGVKNNG